MQLIYTAHQTLHTFGPGPSWIILVGAAYGAVRLVVDAGRLILSGRRRRP